MNEEQVPNADDMFRINGNVESDYKVVSSFAIHMLKEAKKRQQTIHDYVDLKIILGQEECMTIENCELGIRHIYGTVNKLCDFHKQGSLSNNINVLLNDLFDVLKRKRSTNPRLVA